MKLSKRQKEELIVKGTILLVGFTCVTYLIFAL